MVFVGNMNNHRVISRAILSCEDPSNGCFVVRVGTKPVNGFSGQNCQISIGERLSCLNGTVHFAHGSILAARIVVEFYWRVL